MSKFTIKSMIPAEPGTQIELDYNITDEAQENTKVDEVVIAWAIVAHSQGNDTIEPVFLGEYNVPVVWSQWEQDIQGKHRHADPSYEILRYDDIA